MCTDMCIEMCIDRCVDMCIDMCVDMCIEMCIDMCIDVYVVVYVAIYERLRRESSICRRSYFLLQPKICFRWLVMCHPTSINNPNVLFIAQDFYYERAMKIGIVACEQNRASTCVPACV